MVTTSDVNKPKRHQYGSRLMRGFQHFLHDLLEQDITITRFYAIGTTPEGIALLKRARFEEREQIGKRVVFELNPLTSQIRLAKIYREMLRQHKIVQPE